MKQDPTKISIEGNLFMGGCLDGLLLPASFKHLISLYPWESYRVEHQLASLTQGRHDAA
jgi:hypothetical protein